MLCNLRSRPPPGAGAVRVAYWRGSLTHHTVLSKDAVGIWHGLNHTFHTLAHHASSFCALRRVSWIRAPITSPLQQASPLQSSIFFLILKVCYFLATSCLEPKFQCVCVLKAELFIHSFIQIHFCNFCGTSCMLNFLQVLLHLPQVRRDPWLASFMGALCSQRARQQYVLVEQASHTQHSSKWEFFARCVRTGG